MRKLQNACLSILMVAGLGFLGGCSDDAEKPEQKPVIELGKDASNTYEDKEVPAGEVIVTTVNAFTGTPGTNLARLTITRELNDTEPEIILDSTLTKEAVTYVMKSESQLIKGRTKYNFTVTDSKGHYSTTSFTVSTFSNNFSGSLDIFNNVVLGAQQSNNPGFLATNTGLRYSKRSGINNQSGIDMVYLFGANGPALAAPNDPSAISITELRLNSWKKRNATRFSQTSATDTEFNKIDTNPKLLFSIYDNRTEITPNSLINIAPGQVIAFRTVSGKRGLILVKTVSTSGSGSATFDIKVEKTFKGGYH